MGSGPSHKATQAERRRHAGHQLRDGRYRCLRGAAGDRRQAGSDANRHTNGTAATTEDSASDSAPGGQADGFATDGEKLKTKTLSASGGGGSRGCRNAAADDDDDSEHCAQRRLAAAGVRSRAPRGDAGAGACPASGPRRLSAAATEELQPA